MSLVHSMLMAVSRCTALAPQQYMVKVAQQWSSKVTAHGIMGAYYPLYGGHSTERGLGPVYK